MKDLHDIFPIYVCEVCRVFKSRVYRAATVHHGRCLRKLLDSVDQCSNMPIDDLSFDGEIDSPVRRVNREWSVGEKQTIARVIEQGGNFNEAARDLRNQFPSKTVNAIRQQIKFLCQNDRWRDFIVESSPISETIEQRNPAAKFENREALRRGIEMCAVALSLQSDPKLHPILDKVMRINEDISSDELNELFACFQSLVSDPSKECTGKKATGHARSKPVRGQQQKRFEYKKAQKLWSKSKKDLYQLVMKGEAGRNPLDPKVTFDYWSKMFEQDVLADREAPNTVGMVPDSIFGPISEVEFSRALKKMRGKAKGDDGMSFESLSRAPVQLNCLMLNAIMLARTVPKDMKGSRTVLIPKTVPASKDPADYRPISMSSMFQRLHHRILAKRISKYVKFHSAQRGFVETDGCLENVAILDHLIRASRKQHKNLFFACIDVRKAFDSVKHASIIRACRSFGLPDDFIDYIQDVYRDGFTRIDMKGMPRNIRLNSGVRQGCPLSPLLFNMVVDELLRKLDTLDLGVSVGRCAVSSLGFCDDLNLTSRSEQGLQQMLNVCQKFYEQRGLSINPSKSVAVGISSDAKRKKCTTLNRFNCLIGGEEPRFVKTGEAFKYLGVEFDPNGKLKPNLNALKAKLALLKKARLKPNQKFVLLQQFLLPSFLHQLVLGRITIGLLKEFDKCVRKFVKDLLGLSDSTTDMFFYTKRRNGGLGLPYLRYAVPIQLLSRLKGLGSSRNPTIFEFCESDDYEQQVRKLKKLLTIENEVLCSKTKLVRHVRKLSQKTRVGRSLSCFAQETSTNDWLSGCSKSVSGQVYNQFVQMRTETLPCRSNAHTGFTYVPCRYGCRNEKGEGYNETLMHIIQMCKATKDNVISRHHAVRDLVAADIRSAGFRVLTELTVRVPLPSLTKVYRPDIVCVSKNGISVLDVGVTYESTAEKFRETFDRKVAQYRDAGIGFESALLKELNCTDVPIHYGGLVFGSRGAVLKSTVDELKLLGICKKRLKFYSLRVASLSLQTWRAFYKSCGGRKDNAGMAN